MLAIFAVAAAVATGSVQQISPTEQQIIQYIDAHNDEAIELLERVVNINSGTMNHEGVREVGHVFAQELAALGFEVEWVQPEGVNRAGHLFARQRGNQGTRLLLIGHLDTVFEKDSPFQRWERIDQFTAKGPGTEDMKGGNVVVLYALKALHAAGALAGTSIIVAFTGDEEDTGDPLDATRGPLIEAAQESDAALGFEGGVGGMHTATIARRGYTDWYLEVSGQRGHSSLIFSDAYGSGAINETARILHEFYQELTGEQYLTFGPGIIMGGTETAYDTAMARGTAFGKTNVIPQTVTVAGDLRTLTVEQRERAKERMRNIASRNLPRTSAELTFRDSYPPMAPTAGNRELLDQLNQVSLDLGFGPIEAVDPGRRGAADVSFVAPHVNGLDGLGLLGDGGHTTEETIDLRSLPVVTKRAALLVHRLTKRAEGTD